MFQSKTHDIKQLYSSINAKIYHKLLNKERNYLCGSCCEMKQPHGGPHYGRFAKTCCVDLKDNVNVLKSVWVIN